MSTETAAPTEARLQIIDGVAYEIVNRFTVEDEIAAGHLNNAREMRRLRHAAMLFLRRPRGAVKYFTVEFENGAVASNPVSLGRL